MAWAKVATDEPRRSSGLCRRSQEDRGKATYWLDRVTAALGNCEEHKRDHREKLKLMSNKAWAQNQSNDTTRKNLPNHCREHNNLCLCSLLDGNRFTEKRWRWSRGFQWPAAERGMVPEMWDKPLWESVWPYLDLWDSVRLRTTSTHWNVPRKYGRHGEGR